MSQRLKSYRTDNNTLMLEIHGPFSFELVAEFRQAYEGGAKAARQYVVDMSRSEAITSAGLGMLLQMQRWVDDKSIPIKLVGCNDTIVSILHISKFDQLFQINPL